MGRGGRTEADKLTARFSVVRFEEIHASPGTTGTPLPFADCTEAVLAANRCWKEQLVHGAPHWHGNLDVAFGIHQGNQGISVADTNGDGLEDVYICQPDGLPNRFFLQQPDGTLLARDRGTPQGSSISPVLANLFMHYAFDMWLARTFPAPP